MGSITIDGIDDDLATRLRRRAVAQGHSVEDEARTILQDALTEPRNQGQQIVKSFREAFGPLGGVDLELPPRNFSREPPNFK